MANRILVLALAICSMMISCAEKQGDAPISSSTAEAIAIHESRAEFPECLGSVMGKVYFSVEEGKFFICRDGEYIETAAPSTNSIQEEENSSSAVGLCGEVAANPELPDLVPVSGQLAVSLPEDIDPCGATGYVVGFQEELPLKQAANGASYFDNLPAGNLDLIISTEAGLGLVSGGKRGIRLSGVTSLPGVRRELKDFSMPEVSSISGVSRLAGTNENGDHAGILVYIPGTGYAARTDKEGKYTIADVPEGLHNLYFEKDGYHRGQIENASVKSGLPASAATIMLQLSTGAAGFINLANSAEVSQEWVVPVTVGATNNAVLMKISESPTFDNLAWTPVVTSSAYTFSTEGQKTLYVKFADANGLESSPFSDQITVDRFTASESTLTAQAGSASPSLSRTITFAVTRPKHAEEMTICTDPDFVGCNWQAFSNSFPFTFAGEGARVLYVKYRDTDGFESHILSRSVTIDLFPAAQQDMQINAGAAGTNSRVVNLAISSPVNAQQMMICEDSMFFACNWEAATPTRNYTFDSDGYKNLYLKFRDADSFESEVISASILVDTLPPSGAPSVSYTVRQANMTLNSWGISDLNAMEMKVAPAADFGSATWQAFSYSIVMPYSRNLKIQYRDSYGHETAVLDLKVTYTHLLSEARSSLTAGRVGTKILFAGGSKSGGSKSDVVDIYDTTTAFWTTATLSQARSDPAVAVHGSKIYFAGGSLSGDCSSVVDIYDADTGTWSTENLSLARCYLTATSAGDKVLFAGGGSSAGAVYNTVDIYNATTQTWSTATLSVARRFLSSAAVGTDAYFIGGNTNNGSLMTNLVDIYDSIAGTWSTADSLSEVKSEITAVTAEGKIYVAGGSLQGVPIESNLIEIYDPINDAWTTEASVLSTTRQSVRSAYANNLIFFIGGVDYPNPNGGTTNPSSLVDAFDPEDGTVSSSSPLSDPRKFHAVATDGSIVIVGGGMTGGSNTQTNKIDIYDNGNWATVY